MDYRYTVPAQLKEKVATFEEFASGGTQATARLKDGRIFNGLLISNCTAIVALRGYPDLPFSPSDIEDLYQTDEDKNPKERGNWQFWDKWK
jgi:hypothetical protein